MDVDVEGKTQQAVVRDLHRHPGNERVLHIDFQRVSANKPINVNVPLHFINEAECVGVKMNGGTITHSLTDVEVSCLPAAIPEFIEVDMLEIDTGSSVHLSDLNVPEGVVIMALAQGEDHDIPVASVTVPRGGTEEEEAAAAAADEASAEGGDQEDAPDADAGDSEASED